MSNSTKIDDQLLTIEQIERLKQSDERFKNIDLMVQIENELHNSIALKLIREEAAEQAQEAMEELIYVDPTDYNKIKNLQAKVYRARFIAMTLNRTIYKGELAAKSIEDERINQNELTGEVNP